MLKKLQKEKTERTVQSNSAKIEFKTERVVNRKTETKQKIEIRQTKLGDNAVIPVFFAADENYLPYLYVTLQSLKDNASKRFNYEIYILHTGIRENEQERILSFDGDGFKVSFVNVFKQLEEIKNSLQLRDYYTGATYYRIFIANMFPQFDKAVYLDSDIVVLGDISKLYSYDLKNAYVGAVTDAAVNVQPIFRRYTREVLGIESENYFNAGVLLMNLKKFRTDGFYERFKELILEYKFSVAQDQDYLNVLCKDRVKYLPARWNVMPVDGSIKKPELVHYNLTLKPWHYADIPYASYFWKYAQASDYSDEIRKAFGEHTVCLKQKDEKTEAALLALAESECERKDNYLRIKLAEQLNEICSNENIFEEARA